MFDIFRQLIFKQEPYIAVDLSPTSVKLLQLSRSNGAYCVDHYGRFTLPPNLFEGHVLKNQVLFADLIKKITREIGMKGQKVAIAMPDAAVISKVIQVNEGLSDSELEELIMIEADNHIPYPIDEVDFDFHVLGPTSKKSTVLDVLLVASRKENISSRVEAFERADLHVKVVDIESHALERTLPFLSPDALTAEVAAPLIKGILDIGASLTRLYVFEGEKLVFMREEEFGGNQLWLAVAAQYEKTPEEILELQRTNALPADYTETVLKPFVATTAMQVKRLMDFFYSSSHYDETPEIYLSGGPSTLPGLIPLIKEQSNIPVQLANPFARIKCAVSIDREALMKCAPEFLTAFGLALR